MPSENKPEQVSNSNNLQEMFNDFRGQQHHMPSFWLSEVWDKGRRAAQEARAISCIFSIHS